MISGLDWAVFILVAVASVFRSATGGMPCALVANFFTLAGAVCFFSTRYLMIPELFGAAGETHTFEGGNWHGNQEDRP